MPSSIKKKLKKMPTASLIEFVTKDKRWTARCDRRFSKKQDEKTQRKYLIGTYEAWVLDTKLRREFKSKFVQGGQVESDRRRH